MRVYSPLVLLLVVSVALFVSVGVADEGMYPLPDLGKVGWAELQSRGLELERADVYDPNGVDIADACIQLGGGSATFVSPEGLIVTNHHVAFAYLQRASTVDVNLLRDGFYAESREDEVPATGAAAYIVTSIDDVSDRVTEAVAGALDPEEFTNALDSIEKVIIAEVEEGRDVTCEVSSMYGGTEYWLYTHFKIKDIRIVYAPPQAIGSYGGEIDNWMWPRHTGDFAFVRAYVAPDGSSADYSQDNIPYEPKKFLSISAAGVKEGDFTMLLGFPGRTRRHTTYSYLDQMVKKSFSLRQEIYGWVLNMLDEMGKADSNIAIRTAGSVMGLSNGYKNSQAVMDGFERKNVLELKRAEEDEFKTFLQARPELWEKYGYVFAVYDSIYAAEAAEYERESYYKWLQRVDLVAMAKGVYKWSKQRQLEDIERDRGYMDRDSARFIQRVKHAQINYIPEVSRAELQYFLKRILDLPEEQRITPIAELFGDLPTEEPEKYMAARIDSMMDKTEVDDLDRRLEMLTMTPEELAALNDPFIDLAVAIEKDEEQKEDEEDRYTGMLQQLKPDYMRAYMAWKGEDIYPDANSTQRFNAGSVQGYSPRDAVIYEPFTTLSGVIEKNEGEYPFFVPQEVLDVWSSGEYSEYVDPALGDVPVNFLTTNDGTGGNSGSAVINGKGEIVGLDFDTNFQGVIKDYYYLDDDVSRAIVCDSRYMLFLMDRVYGLNKLLEEMTIVR